MFVQTAMWLAIRLLPALLLVAVTFVPAASEAVTMYVRTVGDDANDGLSASTAVRTIGRGASLLGPGDRLVVGPGTYTEGDIRPASVGGVTFLADRAGRETDDPPGEVIIDATGFARGFLIEAKPAVTIDGFVVRGAAIGIQIDELSCRSVVTKVTVLNSTADGILIEDSNDIVVSDTVVRDNLGSGIQLADNFGGIRGTRLTNVKALNNSDRGIRIKQMAAVTIDRCEVAGNAKQGIHVDGGPNLVVTNSVLSNNGDSGVQFGDSPDSIISSCVAYSNNGHGLSALDSNAPFIWNNLVYSNAVNGILVAGGVSGSNDATILHNTIYSNAGRGLLIGGSDAQPPSGSSTVFRNIFQGNVVAGLQVNNLSLPGHAAGYNLSADRYGASTPIGINDIIDLPRFVNPAGADSILGGSNAADDDFHLSATTAGQAVLSPAVDAGDIDVVAAEMADLTTRTDGVPDIGQVDLGYHYGDAVTLPGSVIYVSPQGLDINTGSSIDPLRTIREALRRAESETIVRLEEGTYREATLRPGAGVTIEGSRRGPSIIDANSGSTAFDVREPDVSLLDVGIKGSASAGVRVTADRFRMLGCQVFDNESKGVFITSGEDALIFNNLVFSNGNTGVVVGAGGAGAPRSTILQNTIVNNGNRGITVGVAASVASPAAAIVNNVIDGNDRAGVEIAEGSDTELQITNNCNSDGYVGIGKPKRDIEADPTFAVPQGDSGDVFYLSQVPAGQTIESPCVNSGLAPPAALALSNATTRTDGAGDRGWVDIGFHYMFDAKGVGDVATMVRQCSGDCNEISGDCSSDLSVTVDEIIVGVNIILGTTALTACETLDRDGDGRVTIDELTRAINAVFAS